MFTIFICLRFRDSFTIQTTVIYLNSQIIPDISALTFDRNPPCVQIPDLADPPRGSLIQIKMTDIFNFWTKMAVGLWNR